VVYSGVVVRGFPGGDGPFSLFERKVLLSHFGGEAVVDGIFNVIYGGGECRREVEVIDSAIADSFQVGSSMRDGANGDRGGGGRSSNGSHSLSLVCSCFKL